MGRVVLRFATRGGDERGRFEMLDVTWPGVEGRGEREKGLFKDLETAGLFENPNPIQPCPSESSDKAFQPYFDISNLNTRNGSFSDRWRPTLPLIVQ